MKLNKFTKTIASSAIAAAFISSFAAHATLSDPAEASADVSFTQPLVVSNVLTPVSGLTAGDSTGYVIIAKGTITTTTGTADRHIFGLMNNGTLNGRASGDTDYMTVSGKNNEENKITVTLRTEDGSSSFSQVKRSTYGIGASKDYLSYSTPSDGVTVYTVSLDGDQTVNVDTYTISTAAYAYAA